MDIFVDIVPAVPLGIIEPLIIEPLIIEPLGIEPLGIEEPLDIEESVLVLRTPPTGLLDDGPVSDALEAFCAKELCVSPELCATAELAGSIFAK